jgi:hypothetical protein
LTGSVPRDVEAFDISPDGGCASVNEDGTSRLSVLNLRPLVRCVAGVAARRRESAALSLTGHASRCRLRAQPARTTPTSSI